MIDKRTYVKDERVHLYQESFEKIDSFPIKGNWVLLVRREREQKLRRELLERNYRLGYAFG